MQALVTGGSGFVGRFLVRQLADEIDQVTVMDYDHQSGLFVEYDNVEVHEMDIRNLDENESIVENVDTVYHLSGLLGTTELYERIVEAEEINVLGTIKLLEAMRKNDVRNLVYMSKPHVWENSVYTITKKQSERYIRSYEDVYDFEPKIVRPYNIYGPEERIDIYRKAIPYFVTSALQEKPIEVFGSGEQTMDLVYVEEVAEALRKIDQTPEAEGEVIELGTGNPIAVNEVVSKVTSLIKSQSEVKHIPMRAGEEEDTVVEANTTKMKEVLDFRFTTPLKEGLQKTIDFYKSNLDHERYSDVYEFDDQYLSGD